MQKTIWTTLRLLAEADSKSFYPHYKVRVFDMYDSAAMIVELPVVEVSPRGIYVTVNSPEELGPQHAIRLNMQTTADIPFHRGAFWTKEDCLRYLVRYWTCKVQSMMDNIQDVLHVSPRQYLPDRGFDDVKRCMTYYGMAMHDMAELCHTLGVIQRDRDVKAIQDKAAVQPVKAFGMCYDEAVGQLGPNVPYIYLEGEKGKYRYLYRINRNKRGSCSCYYTCLDLISVDDVVWLRKAYISKKLKQRKAWTTVMPESWRGLIKEESSDDEKTNQPT